MNRQELELKTMALVLELSISAQYTLFLAEQLTHEDVYHKELKVEGVFDQISERNEKTLELSDSYMDFIKAVNTVHLSKMKKYTNVIRALQKDENTVLKTAMEVLKDDFKKY